MHIAVLAIADLKSFQAVIGALCIDDKPEVIELPHKIFCAAIGWLAGKGVRFRVPRHDICTCHNYVIHNFKLNGSRKKDVHFLWKGIKFIPVYMECY